MFFIDALCIIHISINYAVFSRIFWEMLFLLLALFMLFDNVVFVAHVHGVCMLVNSVG